MSRGQHTRGVGTCIIGGDDVRKGVLVPCRATPDGDGSTRGGHRDGHECIVRGVIGGNSENHRRNVPGEYEGDSSEATAGVTGATVATN